MAMLALRAGGVLREIDSGQAGAAPSAVRLHQEGGGSVRGVVALADWLAYTRSRHCSREENDCSRQQSPPHLE